MNQRRKSGLGLFEHARKPSKRVLAIFGIVFGLLLLLTGPSAAVSTYQHAIADGATWQLAFGKAAVAFAALTLLWTLQGALYLFIGCVFVPRMVADFKEIGTGIASGVRGIPSAARATWKFFGDAKRAVSGAFSRLFTGLASLPGRWKAMTGKERFAAFFAALSMALLLVIGYLLWGVAGAVHAWLPTWLQTHHSFVGRLYIDVIMSVFTWAFIMPFWSLFGSFVSKRLFKSGTKNS